MGSWIWLIYSVCKGLIESMFNKKFNFMLKSQSLLFVFCFPLFLFGQTTNPNTKHYIGEKFGGGIVLYVDETGQHGLIAAPQDQSTGIKWGCAHRRIEAKDLNNGQANTKIIIENCGKNTAADLCGSLKIGEYNDWYLPAVSELMLLYQQRMKIEGLTSGDYCSSTEYLKGGNDCWAVHFGPSGRGFHYNKSEHYCVRAIRKF